MTEARPAGFWIRVVAALIDAGVLCVVRLSFGAVAARVWGASVEDSAAVEASGALFTLLFALLYATLLHAATGQTLGKLLVRARVVALDGAPVPVGAALLRCLAHVASCVTLGLGYAMAGLRRDKRALHDLIAGTRVERVPLPARLDAGPPEAEPSPLA